MPRKCCVPGCPSRSIEYKMMHRFPILDPEACYIWVMRIRNKKFENMDWKIVQMHRVCHIHFTDECYRGNTKKSRRLNERCLPTIGLPGFDGEPTKENSFLPPICPQPMKTFTTIITYDDDDQNQTHSGDVQLPSTIDSDKSQDINNTAKKAVKNLEVPQTHDKDSPDEGSQTLQQNIQSDGLTKDSLPNDYLILESSRIETLHSQKDIAGETTEQRNYLGNNNERTANENNRDDNSSLYPPKIIVTNPFGLNNDDASKEMTFVDFSDSNIDRIAKNLEALDANEGDDIFDLAEIDQLTVPKVQYQSLLQKYQNVVNKNKTLTAGIKILVDRYSDKLADRDNELQVLRCELQKYEALVKKIFTVNQIKLLFQHSDIPWDPREILMGFTIRYLSRKAYHILKEKMNYPLPGMATILKWLSTITKSQCKALMEQIDSIESNETNRENDELFLLSHTKDQKDNDSQSIPAVTIPSSSTHKEAKSNTEKTRSTPLPQFNIKRPIHPLNEHNFNSKKAKMETKNIIPPVINKVAPSPTIPVKEVEQQFHSIEVNPFYLDHQYTTRTRSEKTLPSNINYKEAKDGTSKYVLLRVGDEGTKLIINDTPDIMQTERSTYI